MLYIHTNFIGTYTGYLYREKKKADGVLSKLANSQIYQWKKFPVDEKDIFSLTVAT